jgi:hypothetical protein
MRSRDLASEPYSDLLEVKSTVYGGLGVYSRGAIKQGTPLLQTDFIPSHVILKQYRREVCAQCFRYERGRNLKLRDTTTGFSFCSQSCQQVWVGRVSSLEQHAWTAIEAFIKNKSGKGIKIPVNNSSALDRDGDTIFDDGFQRPSFEDVESAWSLVKDTAHFIRQARLGSRLRPHVRALNAALTILPDADTLYFLLAGVICHYQSSLDVPEASSIHPWTSVLALSPYSIPYPTADSLRQHTYAYLQLLSLIPVDLLASVTASICRETAGRDAHNSFGIRSLDDEGTEFFGWGVWPTASYFNHSCEPSVKKRRDGRSWYFWAGRDMEPGEELFISYLGGDEAHQSKSERSKSLEIWSFECKCTKCVREA